MPTAPTFSEPKTFRMLEELDEVKSPPLAMFAVVEDGAGAGAGAEVELPPPALEAVAVDGAGAGAAPAAC